MMMSTLGVAARTVIAAAKKIKVKGKKSKVQKVKIQENKKADVVKVTGPDHSAHSPSEEITEDFGSFHPSEDDIADELSLMGTNL